MNQIPSEEFPVHSTCHSWRKSVPWSLLAPYEKQAKKNHGQSLNRLAERGGLSPLEMFAIVKKLPWHDPLIRDMSETEACEIIDKWIITRVTGKEE